MIQRFKRTAKMLIPNFLRRIRVEWYAYHPNLSQLMYSCSWSIGEDIEKNIDIFVDKSRLNDTSYITRLKRDIIRCYYLYGTNANEYFMHDMEHKNRKERQTVLSKKLKDEFCILAMHGTGPFMQLKDKWAFYQLAGKYFKREALLVDSTIDKIVLKDFLEKHPRFFAKPLEGTWGVGCFDGDISEMGVAIPEQLKSGKWIVEEQIDQDERMELWNASSVNTVRINSFRQKDGSFRVIYPFIRMGRKGMIVDNAGRGGIYASINVLDGNICTDGFDEEGKEYLYHPDSKILFKDWHVPEWNKLIEVVKNIHSEMSNEHKFIGFDMALSTNGWVLVEGNWGDFICQQSSLKKGLKKEFKETLFG